MSNRHVLEASSLFLSLAVLGALATTKCGTSGTTTDAGSDATASPFPFTPSNFDPSAIDLTNLGDIDVTTTTCFLDDQGTLSCGDASKAKLTVVTQPNAGKLAVWAAHSWRIEPNAVLSVHGPTAVALVATGTIDILGGFMAAGQADNGVAGGSVAPTTGSGGSGAGAGGAASPTNAGGGGSYCGVGGIGAALDGGTPAAGGPAWGTAELVPLVGGSTGGGGPMASGAGGGAVEIVAASSVSIEAGGYVDVGGGGGVSGPGGGAGSGGALLIEAPTVTVAGTLAANGGGGGACGTGGSGQDGKPSSQPAAGGTNGAVTCPGGSGSGGTTVNGVGGTAQSTIPTGSGGGGGGAGRIRINTTSGAAALTGATLSPDATTSCTTQGKLK